MTPKEKALQLVDCFKNINECLDKHKYDRPCPCKHQAIDCALIYVDEIIDVLKSMGRYQVSDGIVCGSLEANFYANVKNELLKL